MPITRGNQVWAADITYIPMAKGFCYLVAIMDWASRKKPSWRLSNTRDAGFCIDVLKEAIARFGTPEERRHQGLDSRTPDEVYLSTIPEVQLAA